MNAIRWSAVLFTGALCGCMAASPPPGPGAGASPAVAQSATPLGSPFAEHGGGSSSPLIIDRTDLRLGTTVQFSRIPTTGELHDLSLLLGLSHVVLTLPAWPEAYAPLQSLNGVPPEADLIVVLPGYPPTREAAQAWNLVQARLRLVVVVSGPPPSPIVVGDLNGMRGLERIIAEMDDPSRSGFERLQRPLSFRKVIE